jgi:hypothetical protein
MESRPDILLAPFSAQFWSIFVTAFLILMLSLTATWYLSDRYACHKDYEVFGISNSWFFVISTFCQQG